MKTYLSTGPKTIGQMRKYLNTRAHGEHIAQRFNLFIDKHQANDKTVVFDEVKAAPKAR